MADLKIALARNPNAGMTTILNHLTGLHQHTGNWPGKTVEKKEGEIEHNGLTINIVDFPGTYSLTPRGVPRGADHARRGPGPGGGAGILSYNPPMAQVRSRRTAGRLVALLACGAFPLLAAGCGDNVDVKQSLQVTNVVTGWFDAGIVGGKNKLVPTVSFQVKNRAASRVRYVQLNAVFRAIGDQEELGSMLVKGLDSTGLAPGGTSEAFMMRSALGYTGEQPRLEMLQHSQFRDAQVEASQLLQLPK